jgi:hypothetical protein
MLQAAKVRQSQFLLETPRTVVAKYYPRTAEAGEQAFVVV